MKKNLLILGFGRVGYQIASLAAATTPESPAFDSIIGTILEGEQARGITSGVKVETIVFCPERIRQILPNCSHVLITIPATTKATGSDDPPLCQLYDSMVQLLPRSSWIGILSTTGVYGDHNGCWVNEESDLRCPERTSAAAFRDSERQWQQRIQQESSRNYRLCIFRCAGIYGPDSSALHTLYKQGTPAQDDDEVVLNATSTDTTRSITNRIHIHDLARAILAAANRPLTTIENKTSQSLIYNLADDMPESRQIVMKYAAELFDSMGVAVVKTEKSRDEISTAKPRTRRRTAELKRVCNGHMKRELLFEEGLVFPTYREGLQAIARLPDMPWSSECRYR